MSLGGVFLLYSFNSWGGGNVLLYMAAIVFVVADAWARRCCQRRGVLHMVRRFFGENGDGCLAELRESEVCGWLTNVLPGVVERRLQVAWVCSFRRRLVGYALTPTVSKAFGEMIFCGLVLETPLRSGRLE